MEPPLNANDLKARKIAKQTVYNACLLEFAKSRVRVDQSGIEGINGDEEGRSFFDAREIYYDAESCFTRLSTIFARLYAEGVRNSERLKLYDLLLNNTDALLVVAFIFTVIISKDDDDPHNNALDNVQQSRVGRRIFDDFDRYKAKGLPSIEALRIEFNAVTARTFLHLFDVYQWQLNKFTYELKGGSVDDDKNYNLHKELRKRIAMAKEGTVAQNVQALYYTMQCIFDDAPDGASRLEDAMKVLKTSLILDAADKAQFATLREENRHGMKKNDDNHQFSIGTYDRYKGKDTNRVPPSRVFNEKQRRLVRPDDEMHFVGEARATKNTKQIVKSWRYWELYEQLKRSVPLFAYEVGEFMAKSRVTPPTMQDMDALLYRCTLPFYHERECYLSYAFEQAYDFCLFLREQHYRHRNAHLYLTILDRLLPQLVAWRSSDDPAQITPNLTVLPDYQSLVRYVNFDTRVSLIVSTSSRHKIMRDRRRLDDQWIDALASHYKDIIDPGRLRRMRRTLAMHPFLYFFTIEQVYPLLMDAIWRTIIEKIKHRLHLNQSPFVSLADYRILYGILIDREIHSRSLVPLSQEMFKRHFVVDTSKHVLLTMSVGTIHALTNTCIQETIHDIHTSTSTIKELSNRAVIQAQLKYVLEPFMVKHVTEFLQLYMQLQLASLFDLTHYGDAMASPFEFTRYGDANFVFLRTCRRSIVIDPQQPWLCTDANVIAELEDHGDLYRLSTSSQYAYTVLMRKKYVWLSDAVKDNAHEKHRLPFICERYFERDPNSQLIQADQLVDGTSTITTDISANKEHTIGDLKKMIGAVASQQHQLFLFVLLHEGRYIIVNDIETCDALTLDDTSLMYLIARTMPSDAPGRHFTAIEDNEVRDVLRNKVAPVLFVETRQQTLASTLKAHVLLNVTDALNTFVDLYTVEQNPYIMTEHIEAGSQIVVVCRDNRQDAFDSNRPSLISYTQLCGAITNYEETQKHEVIESWRDVKAEILYKRLYDAKRDLANMMTIVLQRLVEDLSQQLDSKQKRYDYELYRTRRDHQAKLRHSVNVIVMSRHHRLEEKARAVARKERDDQRRRVATMSPNIETPSAEQRKEVRALYEAQLQMLFPTAPDMSAILAPDARRKREEIMMEVKEIYFRDPAHFTEIQRNAYESIAVKYATMVIEIETNETLSIGEKQQKLAAISVQQTNEQTRFRRHTVYITPTLTAYEREAFNVAVDITETLAELENEKNEHDARIAEICEASGFVMDEDDGGITYDMTMEIEGTNLHDMLAIYEARDGATEDGGDMDVVTFSHY